MSKQTDIARAQVLAAENNIKLFKGKGEFFPDRNENDVADWKELESNRQEEILKQYQIAADPNNGFWTRAKSFFAATSKAGRYAKAAKDFALMFTPYGNQIDTVTDFVTERFIKPQTKQREEPMTDILKRVFTTANGGFWKLVDDLGNRDFKYYAALAIRLALAAGVLYVANYFGIPVDKVLTLIGLS